MIRRVCAKVHTATPKTTTTAKAHNLEIVKITAKVKYIKT